MALIGYARVSTLEQDASLQHDALAASGCERIFTDHASGALEERVELARALDHMRAGDALVVWRLDRLGRSQRHLVDTVTALEGRRVGFRCVTESSTRQARPASWCSMCSRRWLSSSGS